MADQPQKSRYETTVDLIKVLVWPLFALVVLFIFWKPFQSTAELLPDLVSRSDTITISQLTIKIDRSITTRPTKEVRQVLAQISPDAIDKILETPADHIWKAEDAEAGKRASTELLSLKLVREMTPDELQNVRNVSYKPVYGVILTDLGAQTRRFLIVIIKEFTQQLYQAQPVTTPTQATP